MKDIQSIIKDAALRYGLKYVSNGTVPMMENEDGTVQQLHISDFEQFFGNLSVNKNENTPDIPYICSYFEE